MEYLELSGNFRLIREILTLSGNFEKKRGRSGKFNYKSLMLLGCSIEFLSFRMRYAMLTAVKCICQYNTSLKKVSQRKSQRNINFNNNENANSKIHEYISFACKLSYLRMLNLKIFCNFFL